MQQLLAQFGDINWQVLAISAAGMAAVVAAAVGFRAMLTPTRDDVVDRLDRVISRGDDEAEQASRAIAGERGPSIWARIFRPIVAIVRPTRADELSRLRASLFQAGFRSDHAMEFFLASKVLLAAGLTLTFMQINSRMVRPLGSPFDIAVAVWLSAAGFLLPSFWLSSRVKARKTTIEQSLPDAMDLLVTCVEAGLGLDAALARVADEMRVAAPVLAGELNLTFLEIQASITRRDAFRRLSERTGVDDLRQLSAVLTQTELFGTSIARALRVHADGMRVKRMQRAEEKAGMVGVKMTLPLILCILPSLMAIVLGPAALAIFKRFINEGN